jgi:hypothetical protein
MSAALDDTDRLDSIRMIRDSAAAVAPTGRRTASASARCA